MNLVSDASFIYKYQAKAKRFQNLPKIANIKKSQVMPKVCAIIVTINLVVLSLQHPVLILRRKVTAVASVSLAMKDGRNKGLSF